MDSFRRGSSDAWASRNKTEDRKAVTVTRQTLKDIQRENTKIQANHALWKDTTTLVPEWPGKASNSGEIPHDLHHIDIILRLHRRSV